jgi:hypothetical protein
MKQYFGLVTAAIFLSALPGPGYAQKDAGMPPMLETQRPLAIQTSQPEPRAPQPEVANPVPHPAKGAKTKSPQGKKCGGNKTNLANQTKANKTIKKKGATAKPRSKVAASRP